MSQESLDKLKEELEYLETVRTKEVAEQIKEARSFGDLSENSEYDDAKTEQGKLYSRIAELKDLVENAQIDNSTATAGLVGHGSKVKVRDLEDDSILEYQIVGSQDANPMIGRVSSDSPFGIGLLGHKKGETITVDAPAGLLRFEILSIDN
jgi:transcription elongation factor GreA